jgi:DNA helicase-2/ATP-dependent DNA helicase PcrA
LAIFASIDATQGIVMESAESLLEGLDEQQRLAATALLGPVRIIASAGSGKTKTISHRIAYGVATGVYAPDKVLALSYTARSAAELRARINALGIPAVQVRTIHAAALAQLRYFWPQLTGVNAPRVIGSKKELLLESLKSLKIESSQSILRELASEIEWWKYSLLSPEEYAESNRQLESINHSVATEVVREYEKLKSAQKLIDWEDVLLLTLGMVQSEPRVSEHVRSQYRFFTIDEFQDVSPLQFALLEQWLGDRSDLCVVGDPRQTIYSFAGASQGYLTGFESRFESTVSVELSNNYRSGVEVVKLANRVMGDFSPMSAISGIGSVSFKEFPNEAKEASSIATMIAEDIENGIAESEIAVLFRVNSQAEPISQQLSELHIRHQLKTQEKFFQQPVISQAVQLIRASRFIEQKPASEVVADVLRSLGWTLSPSGELSNWESLQALYEALTEQELTISETIELIDSLQLQQFEPVRQLVTLSTIHAAKGLEWKKVYFIGVSEGLVPFKMATTEEQINEERRLCYVATTRAKQQLIISHSKHSGELSRFLRMPADSRN